MVVESYKIDQTHSHERAAIIYWCTWRNLRTKFSFRKFSQEKFVCLKMEWKMEFSIRTNKCFSMAVMILFMVLSRKVSFSKSCVHPASLLRRRASSTVETCLEAQGTESWVFFKSKKLTGTSLTENVQGFYLRFPKSWTSATEVWGNLQHSRKKWLSLGGGGIVWGSYIRGRQCLHAI